VHCRSWNAWPDSVLAKVISAVRPSLIWSVHGYHGRARSWPRKRLLAARILARLTDSLLSVSADTAQEFGPALGVAPERFRIIRNGVDCARFRPFSNKVELRRALRIPRSAFVFLTVASFTPVKNHLALLEAAALERAPDVRYVFVGDGGMRRDIETAVKRRRLEDIVELAGESDSIPEYLGAADAFVLPSIMEGSSNALLEAMASGLPVIANAGGGTKELIEHGVSGLLCQTPTPQELAFAIRRLHSDTELRRRMALSARTRAEQYFSLDAMMNNYADYYRRVYRRHLARRSRMAHSGVA
jgi:glycosyltransferase involved in cell wall biosynthesis